MKRMLNQFFKTFAIILFGGALAFTSCKEDDTLEVREVKFNIGADRTQITQSDTINYSDNSKDVASREWTFGGGNIPTSTNETEAVIYPDSGRFETTLTVNFNDGTSEDRLIYIDVQPFVVADFQASATTAILDSDITFTNTTMNVPAVNSFPDGANFENELETWVWEFPGGTPETSTEMSPVVRYPAVGTYTVKLTASRNYPEHTDVEEKVGYINIVDVAVISPNAVHTCDVGTTLRVTYPESIGALPMDALTAFSVSADGNDLDVASLEVDPSNDMSLIFSLNTPVLEGQSVMVNYDPSVILLTAQSGSLFAPLDGFLVENRVVNNFTGNLSFENGTVGDFPPDWGTWNPDQSINNNEKYMIVDNQDAPSGSNSLMWTYDGSGDFWICDNKTPEPIIVDGTYRIVFNAKSSMDGALLDARVIESGWAANIDPADFALTTEWQEYSFDFVADGSGNQDRKFWMRTMASSDVFDMHIDNIRMYYVGCD
ncbi:MAG: PKD domain-containing protein [Bacteroidota bacterium]